MGAVGDEDLDVLDQIQRRVLWLAVRMVDHANRQRPDAGGVKVGGHQASSASMVSIMTALWFDHLASTDKVAVKPHASPVFHSIKYLTGELDRSWLTTLRAFGGLQAYPSRTKDPDVTDFSTGSVGLGAVAPLFAAGVHRYLRSRIDLAPSRFIALLGDAELDEGNVWEAIAEPALEGLGEVMLVVDLNRQSLDRVIPGVRAQRLQRLFADAGWHVVTAKYGRRLTEAFARPGGEALRAHIDAMDNERYQRTFALTGDELRAAFCDGADAAVTRLLDDVADGELARLVHDLGGHDLAVLGDAYRRCDAEVDRPSVVFAYTIKGWGLPNAGDPLNHAALLNPAQIDALRAAAGLDGAGEWDRFDPRSPAGRRCAVVGAEMNNPAPTPRPTLGVPSELGLAARRGAHVSSQEAFGRLMVRLADHDAIAERVVTTSPDVSISTNLGGWINKVGVFAPQTAATYGPGDALLRWEPTPTGRHIELGISEMNLFLLLGQLGLAHEHHGHALLPVGTVYDPFVLRGLDALVYSLYNDARFVVVGTPSGVTLAPEGGAHQSSITASAGIELPGLTYSEPTYATELDWVLCHALGDLAAPDGRSSYLRLSTRPIDQAPFDELVARRGAEAVRADVLAGGYRLVEPENDGPALVIATCGAVVPEALAAGTELTAEGVAVTVVVLTSADRLHRGWRDGITAGIDGGPDRRGHLGELLTSDAERRAPIVTAHDAASHALGWLGSVHGAPVVPVGVDEFGQSGTVGDLHRAFGLDVDHLVNAGLLAVDRHMP